MTVVPLPARRKATDRRRAPQIYDAAAHVFAQRGFHGATTQDIADLLGIRQASLYYYFASKEAALELVCLKGVEGFFESAKAIAKGPGSCANRLSRMIDSHLSPLADRADYIRVFLNERQHLPQERRQKIGKWSQGLERVFEDVLKEGIRKGEFRGTIDTRIVVLGILGMVNWTVVWFGKEEASLSHIGGEFSRMVLEGICGERPRKTP